MQNILMALALAGEDAAMQLSVHTRSDTSTFDALEYYFKNNGLITNRSRFTYNPPFKTFDAKVGQHTVTVFGDLSSEGA